MKNKFCVITFFSVKECLPPKSDMYLVYDGLEVKAEPYSIKHNAFGVFDSMAEKHCEWCKIDVLEWAYFPAFNDMPELKKINLLED